MGFTAPSGWNIWKMRFEKQSEGESDMKYYSTRDAAVRKTGESETVCSLVATSGDTGTARSAERRVG